MGRHAGQHVFRRFAQTLCRPNLADHLKIAADPARRDNDGVAAYAEITDDFACGLSTLDSGIIGEDRTAHPRRGTVCHFDLVGFMAIEERDAPCGFVFFAAPNKMLQHARPRAPCDVKARHGIAMTIRKAAAPFGPA